MAARDIEYVELYASDRHRTVDYLVSSFGFTRIAESADSNKNSTLLRQGGVQLVVTAGPATAEFLDIHGDGVADIAFSCDDVGATCAEVVAMGGIVLDSAEDKPVVSGFGSAGHTLLPVTVGGGHRLPPGRRWAMVPGVPSRPAGQITGLDHIATCFDRGELAYATDFYRAAFGLDWYSSDRIEAVGQAVHSVGLRSRYGGITLAMLEPGTPRNSGQLDSFLERNKGTGVWHLAFLVDAIVHTAGKFRRRGVGFLAVPDVYYDTLGERCPGMREEIADLRAAGVLADCDEWGYLLQLFTRPSYERNALCCELIQRRGARRLGTAILQALHEAPARGHLVAG
jgi:4-hydroxymandelate synthase